MYAISYDEYVKQPYNVWWYLTKIKDTINFIPGFHAFQLELKKKLISFTYKINYIFKKKNIAEKNYMHMVMLKSIKEAKI